MGVNLPPIYPVRPAAEPQNQPPPPPAVPEQRRSILRELFRMRAVTATVLAVPMPSDAVTLVVFNPISVPIYLRWDQQAPTLPGAGISGSKAYDVAVPGNAVMVWPIPDGAAYLSALLNYPTPVAADTDQQAQFNTSTALLQPAVSPLA